MLRFSLIKLAKYYSLKSVQVLVLLHSTTHSTSLPIKIQVHHCQPFSTFLIPRVPFSLQQGAWNIWRDIRESGKDTKESDGSLSLVHET